MPEPNDKYSPKGIFTNTRKSGIIFLVGNVICSLLSFYKLPDGSEPALEFIRRIPDKKLKAKVFRSLKLLEIYGNRLQEPDTKYLGNGIFELRTKQGSNIVRNLLFFHKEKIIVVTNCFAEKTAKTPSNETELALKRKKDYEEKKRTVK